MHSVATRARRYIQACVTLYDSLSINAMQEGNEEMWIAITAGMSVLMMIYYYGITEPNAEKEDVDKPACANQRRVQGVCASR